MKTDRIKNYMEPVYDDREIEAVYRYMQSGGWLTEYKKTREFEKGIKEYLHTKNCSVMSNGTVTLMAALLACGIKPGDEVIVPDFTMAATSHAVEILGAHAVFADIERNTLCIEYNEIVRLKTKKTKAIIVVDLNGRYPSRFSKIKEFCSDNHIWLIEDAAQALGSKYEGQMLGTVGDIGSFSFSMPKIITTGQGGAIVTNNDELFDRILRIRDFGREQPGGDHYLLKGANFKFTDIQAVLGIEQMMKLPSRVKRKKQMWRRYKENLSMVKSIEVVYNSDDTVPCFIEIICAMKKEALQKFLQNKGIGTRAFYPPLHSEPAYHRDHLSFPITEEVSKNGLWLPSSVNVTDDDIDYICNCIKEFYKNE